MVTETFKFSKSKLSALPTPAKRTYYKDSETRGLLLAALPSGTKSFQIYRKVNGKPVRIGIGHFDFSLPESRTFPSGTDLLSLVGNSPQLNVAMAKILAGVVNSQLDMGINPASVKSTNRKNKEKELTLQDAFDLYKSDYLVPQEIRTIDDLEDIFNRNLGYVAPGQKKPKGREKTKNLHGVDWSKRKLSEISNGDVLKLHNKLKVGGSAYTANRTLELLRPIFNKMKLWGRFNGNNPCIGIEYFDEQERERYIKEEELPLFFDALSKVTDDNFKDFVWLSLFTGARRRNVLGMKWQDIDFGTGLWSIAVAESKSKIVMCIPLTAPALETLARRRKEKSEAIFVFPANSKSGFMTPPKKKWAALLKVAGLENLRLHDLRRTLASWSASTGASLLTIGKSLGHASTRSTQVYARLNNDTVRSATNLAAATMLSLGNVSSKDLGEDHEEW